MRSFSGTFFAVRAGSVLGRIGFDSKGSAAVIFALVLIPICAAMGMAVDYSRAITLKDRLQGLADSSALAAVAAASKGSSTEVATDVAMTLWSAGAGMISNSQNTVPMPTITTTTVQGVTTAVVDFSGTQKTSFSSVIGMNTLAVGGVSEAQASQSITKSNGYSGTGDAWGDPHLDGADGHETDLNCQNGKWYNLLSDVGIELNIVCMTSANGDPFITGFSVVLGSHNVQFITPQWSLTTGQPTTPYHPGLLTIDGVPTQAAYQSTNSYLNNQVTFLYQSTEWGGSTGYNKLYVTTSLYNIEIESDGSRGMSTTITATGAGTCQTPGGAWGHTLAGIDDGNGADFLVSGPKATTAEFSGPTSCPTAVGKPHLIK